jgi:hypothetical protein
METCRTKASVEQREQRLHISVSQINEYLDCSVYYMFHRVYKMPVQARSYFTVGRSVHYSAAVNFRQKLRSKKNISLPDYKEVTAHKFDRLADETLWDKDEEPGKVKDLTVKLAELFYTEVAEKVQPLMVEKKIVVDLPEIKRPVIFRLDLVDENEFIHEIKTPGKTPTEGEIFKNLQLSGYVLAYYNLTGKMPQGVQMDNLVKTKVPKYAPLVATRNERDIQRFKNVANAAIDAIQAGSYVPNYKSWKCSVDSCDYWNLCHEVF